MVRLPDDPVGHRVGADGRRSRRRSPRRSRLSGQRRRVCRRAVRTVSRAGRARRETETVKPDDPRCRSAHYEIIGNRQTALEGAAACGSGARLYVVHVMPAADRGRGAGCVAARSCATRAGASRQARRPSQVLRARGRRDDGHASRATASGDATRSSRWPPRRRLRRSAGRRVLASAGTDGIDGPTDAAGAWSIRRRSSVPRLAGVDWESTLAGHDAYHFFAAARRPHRLGPDRHECRRCAVMLLVA